jgi:hypothetical protein
MSSNTLAAAGTALAPNYQPGPLDLKEDVSIQQRYFTYETQAGPVVGKTLSVMFTLDRPARAVWPYFKDFNLWQNSYRHYYSGVVGDLEGQSLALAAGERPKEFGPPQYKVMRVIPEHLIVLFQPVVQDGGTADIGPDTHVFMLTEHGGRTTVTALMEHSFRKPPQEGVAFWAKIAPDSQLKWRDYFIPTLKKLVYEGTAIAPGQAPR